VSNPIEADTHLEVLTVDKPSPSSDRTRAIAAISLLAKAFPKCFSLLETRRLPLKVGIKADIVAKLSGAQPEALRVALKFYCENLVYLSKLVAGAQRFDLAGKVAGAVTADQEAQAKAILAQRRLNKKKLPRQAEARP
jgi:sRNA-binding protein